MPPLCPAHVVSPLVPPLTQERRELEEEQRQILEAAARRKLEEEAARQAEKLQNLQQQWRNAAVMEKVRRCRGKGVRVVWGTPACMAA